MELLRSGCGPAPLNVQSLSAVHAGRGAALLGPARGGPRGDPPRAEAGAPFFATTFLVGAMGGGGGGTDSLPKAVRDRGYRFFTTDELEESYLRTWPLSTLVVRRRRRPAPITCAALAICAVVTTGGEWRAACDGGVVVPRDFGVRMRDVFAPYYTAVPAQRRRFFFGFTVPSRCSSWPLEERALGARDGEPTVLVLSEASVRESTPPASLARSSSRSSSMRPSNWAWKAP